MTVSLAKVEIVSGTDVGGQYPFVVVCLDDDLKNEVYKSKATLGGHVANWNETFEVDLGAAVKKHKANGHGEPSYLTFLLFDTGEEGVPLLGSAGVLLQTLYDNGIAEGDFPIINGNGGVLTLIVRQTFLDKIWHNKVSEKLSEIPHKLSEFAGGAGISSGSIGYPGGGGGGGGVGSGGTGGIFSGSNAKKIAVGAVGVGAITAGLTALAVNQKKKKRAAVEAAERERLDAERHDRYASGEDV